MLKKLRKLSCNLDCWLRKTYSERVRLAHHNRQAVEYSATIICTQAGFNESAYDCPRLMILIHSIRTDQLVFDLVSRPAHHMLITKAIK
jgi:hypothetical protein